ncbi:MAG: hypothetical protein H0U86_02960 [Chloroflexi bacterium]|nr:hypothetical protein [Chloroflexota bacterium]
MTQLDLELAALRARRRSPGLLAWLRGLRTFDRRAIRDPDKRDVYWLNVQRRLAESDADFLLRHADPEPPHPPAPWHTIG